MAFDSLWTGPYVDGITQSLITVWDECPERAYLKMVEGLKEYDTFDRMAAIEWGNAWHEGEEALLDGRNPTIAISSYCRKICLTYPDDTFKISKLHSEVQLLFQEYAKWWEKHPINITRQPYWAEESFAVPYRLPDSRLVKIRGKFDAVYKMGTRRPKMYLQENKSKGRINEHYISNTLTGNFQVMFYMTALHQLHKAGKLPHPIGGVIYNVVRNPSNRTKDLKTSVQKDPAHYFKRWQHEISTEHIETFEQRTLIPKLSRLCDWWDWIVANNGNRWAVDEYGIPGGGHHWQQPWGIYKTLHERHGAYYDLLVHGKTTSYEQATTLFPEL